MRQSGNSISTIITVTIPIASALASFLALLLDVQQAYAHLLILFYVAGILIATVFKRDRLEKISFDKRFYYFVISLVIAVIIPLVLYLTVLKPVVTIDDPPDQSEVNPGKIIVSGTANNLPKNGRIWLINYHSGFKTYYPQKEVLVKNKKWDGQVILPHGNTEYEIWAIIVNLDESNWYATHNSFAEWEHRPRHFEKIKINTP